MWLESKAKNKGKSFSGFRFGVLLLFFFEFGAFTGRAQNSTSSPYSYYGIGEMTSGTNATAMGMGGTHLANRNPNQLNFHNPASLTALDSMKFIFNVGTSAKFTQMNQKGEKDSFNDINLSGFSFAFRAAPRWYSGLALLPFSTVGYEVSRRTRVEGGADYYNSLLKGSGGVSQLIWSNAVKLTDGLSLGVNSIFLFGSNDYTETIAMESENSYHYTNRERMTVKDILFNAGLQYSGELNSDWNYTLAGFFQARNKVSGELSTVTTSYQGNYGDTINAETLKEGNLRMPMEVGLGVGFFFKNRLWLGSDYSYQKWSKASFLDNSDYLVDRQRISIGGEYQANDVFARSLWRKMTYRMGAYYDSGYMELKDERIMEYGVSVGLGIPIARGKGMLNLGVEYGKMGTTTNGLIREDFTRITLDITLFESWFFKRKYD